MAPSLGARQGGGCAWEKRESQLVGAKVGQRRPPGLCGHPQGESACAESRWPAHPTAAYGCFQETVRNKGEVASMYNQRLFPDVLLARDYKEEKTGPGGQWRREGGWAGAPQAERALVFTVSPLPARHAGCPPPAVPGYTHKGSQGLLKELLVCGNEAMQTFWGQSWGFTQVRGLRPHPRKQP